MTPRWLLGHRIGWISTPRIFVLHVYPLLPFSIRGLSIAWEKQRP